MIRTLLIIAGAALLLCIVTLSGAAAVGGSDLKRHGWSWTFQDGDGENHTVDFRDSDNGPMVTRNLEWTGGERLKIDTEAEVVFTQGDVAEVRVTGPQTLVDRLRLVNGRLTLADLLEGGDANAVKRGNVSVHWSSRSYGPEEYLRIFITAPSVRSFELNTGTDLSIRNYNQPSLDLRVSGAGDVDVAGQTRSVTVDLDGAGEIDLSALETVDATVDLTGAGDVRVGPTGSARIDVSGAGDVELTRRPANLQQSVSGSGDIVQN